MLSLLGDVNIGPNNESQLLNVAVKISEATKAFISRNDGSELFALDGIISGTEKIEELESTTITEQDSIDKKQIETPANTGGKQV